MKQKILAVLAISSILLGVYILVVSVMNHTPSETKYYHIGCYLQNNIPTKSLQLKLRLRQLQQSGNFRRTLDNQIKQTEIIDGQLHDKSVSLTKSVQSYIEKLTLQKQYQQSNKQFNNLYFKAKSQYAECYTDLKQRFNKVACHQLYSNYTQCLGSYNIQRQNLEVQYQKRKIVSAQVEKLFKYNPKGNNFIDPTSQLQKIKENYQLKKDQNEKQIISLKNKFQKIQIQNNSKSNQYWDNKRKLDSLQNEFNLCLKSIKQQNDCQNITNVLRQYGYEESINDTNKRIEDKRLILNRLRDIWLKTEETGKNNTIMKMYYKNREEYKQIIKLRIDILYFLNTACGCTKPEQERLEAQIIRTRQALLQSQLLFTSYTLALKKIEVNITEAEEYQKKLFDDFRNKSELIKNKSKGNSIDIDEEVKILLEKLEKIDLQIRKHEQIIYNVESNCNHYKRNMAFYISGFNQVIDCLTKKHFYDEIRAKAQYMIHKDQISLQDYKNKVKLALSQIKHPKSIEAIQHTIEDSASIGYLAAETIQKIIQEQLKTKKVEEKRESIASIDIEHDLSQQRNEIVSGQFEQERIENQHEFTQQKIQVINEEIIEISSSQIKVQSHKTVSIQSFDL